jgi:DUF4097 and DUF4098 domain-containing protein YvlB
MKVLTLILIALLGAGAPSMLAGQEDDYRSRIDTVLALSREGTVDLGLVSGEITVTGSNRSNVSIKAYSEHGRLELDATSSRVTLRVHSVRRKLGDTRYDVLVPAGTRVIMQSVSGDLSVQGTRSEVEANSVSGSIIAGDVAGRVSASTVSGDVEVSRGTANIRGNAVSGDLEIRDITGEIQAESVSGEIMMVGVRSSFVRARSVSGEIFYEGPLAPNGRYEFSSHSGDVRLDLPEQTNAVVSAQTFSGSLDSQFPVRLEGGAEIGRMPKQIEFTIGTGGARVFAESFSGDIILVRGRQK